MQYFVLNKINQKKKFERVIDVAITPSNLSFFNVQKNFTDSLHLLFKLKKFFFPLYVTIKQAS